MTAQFASSSRIVKIVQRIFREERWTWEGTDGRKFVPNERQIADAANCLVAMLDDTVQYADYENIRAERSAPGQVEVFLRIGVVK